MHITAVSTYTAGLVIAV